MPPRFQGPYPPEFRREAIRLVRPTGRRYQDVARELGISGEALRQWIKQDQLEVGERDDGLTTSEREELRRLRKQVRELEAEREILKRAVTASWKRGPRRNRSGSLRPRPSPPGRPAHPNQPARYLHPHAIAADGAALAVGEVVLDGN